MRHICLSLLLAPLTLWGSFDLNSLYIDFTYKNYNTSHFWNKTGSRHSAHNSFTKNEYELFIAYDVTCKDTLSLQGSWARAYETMNGRNFGFSDLELAWTRQICCRGDHTISTRLLANIPVDDSYNPAIAYGKFGGELDLIYTWRQAEVGIGYRAYEGFPSDQIRAMGCVSCNPCERLTLSLQGRVDWGLFNGKNRTDASLFLYQPNYRLVELKVEASYRLYHSISTNIGYFQHLWGENIGTGGGFYGGLQICF